MDGRVKSVKGMLIRAIFIVSPALRITTPENRRTNPAKMKIMSKGRPKNRRPLPKSILKVLRDAVLRNREQDGHSRIHYCLKVIDSRFLVGRSFLAFFSFLFAFFDAIAFL